MSKKQSWFVFTKDPTCEPFEYYCSDCKQLRLSFCRTDKCRICGSDKIVKGQPGTLEKESAHGMEGQNEGMGWG